MHRCCLALLLVFIAVRPAAAQYSADYDMGIVHVVLLYGEAPDAERLDARLADGTLALWGATEGEDDLRAVAVVPTDSLALAQEVAADLAAESTRSEVVPWYVARNLLQPATPPFGRTDYVFGVLVRGPSWSAEQTDEARRIQEGHMATINRLAQEGTLALAGPFVEGGDRRGVFIFKVETLEEARRLTATDPAVASGRLAILLYRWSVPEGILP